MKTKTLTDVDQEKIEKEKAQQKVLVTFCQRIYDMFNRIGIPIVLDDINTIVGCTMMEGYYQTLQELITKRLLELPTNSHLIGQSGYTVGHELKVPDYSSITKWIRDNIFDGYEYQTGVNIPYLQLVKGEVSKRPDADKLIAAKYTKTTIVPDYEAINSQKRSGFRASIKNLFK